MSEALLQSEIPGMKAHRGKVRDMYDFGDKLLIVTTDRISAYDYVLPTGIPDKGRVLTGLSAFWFIRLAISNHWISTDPRDVDLPEGTDVAALEGRSMVVYKARPIPVECIVRGYITGSGWKSYQETGTVCEIQLPSDLTESSKLPQPIFTPTTKAEEGEHDANMDYNQMIDYLAEWTGDRTQAFQLAAQLRRKSIEIYRFGWEHGQRKGIIIADTKFEFGLTADGELMLIDEVLTPDSSRFWPADQYEPGHGQPSFDKQFVRDWLTNETDWDRNSPPPPLPDDVVAKTREKYIEAYERLVGSDFPWK